jgi:hypothetical protein
MAKKGCSRADENRRIRQEELRAKMAAGGHLEHVIEIAEEMHHLAQDDRKYVKDGVEMPMGVDKDRIAALEKVANVKLRLVAKYLPDLKAIEHDFGPVKERVKMSFKLS